MTSTGKEAVMPLSKKAEEQLSIWYNNINLKIDLAKEIEKKKKEIIRLNNIINELEKYVIDKEIECNGKIINYSISVEERIKYGNYNDIYDNVLDKLKELKENK